MKTQFIATNSRKEAAKEMAWAGKIIKVDGGYMGFESIEDCNAWKRQK